MIYHVTDLSKKYENKDIKYKNLQYWSWFDNWSIQSSTCSSNLITRCDYNKKLERNTILKTREFSDAWPLRFPLLNGFETYDKLLKIFALWNPLKGCNFPVGWFFIFSCLKTCSWNFENSWQKLELFGGEVSLPLKDDRTILKRESFLLSEVIQ